MIRNGGTLLNCDSQATPKYDKKVAVACVDDRGLLPDNQKTEGKLNMKFHQLSVQCMNVQLENSF